MEGLPSIMLGREGISIGGTKKPEDIPNRWLKTSQNAPEPKKPMSLQPPSDDFIEKLRKWGVFILIAIIAGYASWRIIVSILT